MINVSNAFKQAMYSADYNYTIRITFEDQSVVTLGNEDISASGNSISAQFGTSSMPLGVAMSKELTLKLTNEDGRWDDKEFQFAEVYVTVSLPVGSGTETVKLGTYYVAEPAEYGAVVELKAYDKMYKAGEVMFKAQTLPSTMGTILSSACTQGGLLLDSGTVFNSNFEIRAIPDGLTCRQVIGYCAMIAGGNAFISALDEDVVVKRYTAPVTGCHAFTEYKSVTVGTDDITITGISYTEDETKYESGDTGYVLSIENDLFGDNAQGGVDAVALALVGFTFRNMTVQSFRYPLIEPMDACTVTDMKGRTANTVVTDYTFDFTGFTEAACNADSQIRNAAAGAYQSPTVKAVIAAREEVKKEKIERELAIEALQKEIQDATGMYSSSETQPDGSVIAYLHDKPTMEESKLIVKISSIIGISTDGGETWPYSLDLYDGTAILNKIYAQGIDANYITVNNELLPQMLADFNKRVEDSEALSQEAKDSVSEEIGKLDNKIDQNKEEIVQTTEGLIEEYKQQILKDSNGVFSQMKVDTGGVHIFYVDPSSENIGEINLNGSEILFKINGIQKSKITSSGFHFDYGILTTALQIGNINENGGEWVWTKSPTGHFRLVHRG